MSGVVYGILWILVNGLGRVFLRYRTSGTEHIPKTGGILLAANHASYADIPLLGCGVGRRLWYLGRSNLFPHPLFNKILQALGWIPLRPERLDRRAFGVAHQLLKEGKAVVIFPEGTRTHNGQLQPGKPGIGVIVAEAQCPVIPVYIQGTYDFLPMGSSWPRLSRVEVKFGQPLHFHEDNQGLHGKAFFRHVSQTVMERIAELGNVAQPAGPTLSTPVTQPPTTS